MAFLDLAKERWTCRRYSDKPVEQEKLNAILEAARIAPTAKDIQPFHIWVVKSEEARGRLDQTTKCLYGAPVALIVAGDSARAYIRADGKNYADIDASIVGTHIILEAADLGLGSTWIGAYDSPKLKELFPELGEYVDVALFAIGYPADDARPAPSHTERKSVRELVTVL